MKERRDNMQSIIDLSYHPKKEEPKEPGLGIVILTLMPFSAMLAWMLLSAA